MGHDTVETPNLSFGRGGRPGRGTPYAQYVRLEELHSLQHPRSKEPAELSFIVTTQVMELLFDLLRHEWTIARQALREDDLTTALAALRRGTHVQDVLVESWDLLATMTPQEFNSFRALFGEASGFQSSAFLHLEFLLGNKNAALLNMYDGMPETQAELTEALRSPGLYDEVLGLLARHGLAVHAEPSEQRYRPSEEVAAAWRRVYTEPEFAALQPLGEALLDVAERVTRWRQRHLSSVKRTMGAKPGSGGSSGLTWLRKAAEQDVFPELWTIRDEL
ncbi:MULTISPECIES: tryptophan 2,3-dioxygenase [Kitasatospora]|uniref:Tryptophan 2,3-dioxygenase n=1 Tax=Kitasatospora cathayae TaxID=3004092 RepID=A0ABY7Q8K9_9ACTN|nr:tryptophan 2,3-dioxygenase family protein [Kitasatospora sp. HUAS 3-15]WBP89057.1 tryptophan 2,3-dioxygenase family protein [Kitasatospora sp. HUAS 3-15]